MANPFNLLVQRIIQISFLKNNFTLGIDIGGTKTLISLFSTRSEKLWDIQIPTESRLGHYGFESKIKTAIQDGLTNHNQLLDDVRFVGIGGPGPMDIQRGLFNNPYTLPGLEDWNIVQFFKNWIGVEVSFENDADMAAYAEYRNLKTNPNSMLMLTVGTGIGGSVLLDGKILRGVKNEHPEYGLIPVLETNNGHCYSGVDGSLESWTSGSALKLSTERLGLSNVSQLFSDECNEVSSVMEKISLAWKRGIQVFLHTYYPEVIVLGGGVIDHQYPIYKEWTRTAIKNSNLIDGGNVNVVKASLGNLAGSHGAALYAQDKFNSLI